MFDYLERGGFYSCLRIFIYRARKSSLYYNVKRFCALKGGFFHEKAVFIVTCIIACADFNSLLGFLQSG